MMSALVSMQAQMHGLWYNGLKNKGGCLLQNGAEIAVSKYPFCDSCP